MYIDVAVALPIFNSFTYHVDDNLNPLVSVGKRVLVPFGKRRVTGYIVGIKENGDQSARAKQRHLSLQARAGEVQRRITPAARQTSGVCRWTRRLVL